MVKEKECGWNLQEKTTIEERLKIIPDQLETVRAKTTSTQLADAYWHVGYTICHNIGCFFRWDDQVEKAITFFERALTYRNSPLGNYFYAGLLASTGDRTKSLVHLQKALADPRSSLIHRIENVFKDDRYFASVKDDPEFLSIIRAAKDRYSMVGARETTA
jgi:tetratricopeptide (TPR) repeat protein